MARPKIPINAEQVKSLAGINCSLEEMGAVLGCSEDTLSRRFADVIKEGRSTGRMSLKRKQWEMAMGGNITMLIWLGKQLLGQTDKREYEVQAQSKSEVEIKPESLDRIEKLVDTILNDSKA